MITEKQKAAQKKFYQNHKEQIKQKSKLYRITNKKNLQATAQKYRHTHKEKISEIQKAYRVANKEKLQFYQRLS